MLGLVVLVVVVAGVFLYVYRNKLPWVKKIDNVVSTDAKVVANTVASVANTVAKKV